MTDLPADRMIPILPCRSIVGTFEFEFALDVMLDGLERLRQPRESLDG